MDDMALGESRCGKGTDQLRRAVGDPGQFGVGDRNETSFPKRKQKARKCLVLAI